MIFDLEINLQCYAGVFIVIFKAGIKFVLLIRNVCFDVYIWRFILAVSSQCLLFLFNLEVHSCCYSLVIVVICSSGA